VQERIHRRIRTYWHVQGCELTPSLGRRRDQAQEGSATSLVGPSSETEGVSKGDIGNIDLECEKFAEVTLDRR
jgi:hypothetical protein